MADDDWDSDIAIDDVAGGEVAPMWTVGQSLNVGPTRKRSESRLDTCHRVGQSRFDPDGKWRKISKFLKINFFNFFPQAHMHDLLNNV